MKCILTTGAVLATETGSKQRLRSLAARLWIIFSTLSALENSDEPTGNPKISVKATNYVDWFSKLDFAQSLKKNLRVSQV